MIPTLEHHQFHEPNSGVTGFLCYAGDPDLAAIGGCRIQPYPTLAHAKRDAERLAISMYHKAKAYDLPLAGAKMVCDADRHSLKDADAFFEFLGNEIQAHGGRYVVAMDSGVRVGDMDTIATRTAYVSNGSKLGSPDIATAQGVISSIEWLCRQVFRIPLAKLRLSVIGVGAVGSRIVSHFQNDVGSLSLCDTRESNLKYRFNQNVRWLPLDCCLQASCDILVPCALSEMIGPGDLATLGARAIVSTANNPLTDGMTPSQLLSRGVLCFPDYLSNAGGLIQCAANYYKKPEWLERLNGIPQKLEAWLENNKVTPQTLEST